MVDIDKDVRKLVDALDLDNEEILKNFNFTLGEKKLSHEESLKFIEFLRNELSAMKTKI